MSANFVEVSRLETLNGEEKEKKAGGCMWWKRTSRVEKILIIVVMILVLLLVIVTALHGLSSPSFLNASELCLTPVCLTVASAVLSSMDQSANPCTDFYQYACGGWIKSHPLPYGKDAYDVLQAVSEKSQNRLKQMLEDENFELKSEAERKARAYYEACMNETQVERLRAKPLLDVLKKIGGWSFSDDFNINQWSFQKCIETTHNEYRGLGLFYTHIREDDYPYFKKDVYILTSGTLSLPNDRYINETKADKVLPAYLKYMTKVGVLLGSEANSVRSQMGDVIEFETELAKMKSRRRGAFEDPYQKKSVKELDPMIDWNHYLDAMFKFADKKFLPTYSIMVDDPKYLHEMSKIVTKYLSTTRGKITINNYLVWSVVRNLLPYLSKEFQHDDPVLDDVVSRSDDKENRGPECLADTSSYTGYALAAMYVRDAFDSESKRAVLEIIHRIRETFKESLSKLEWMDSEERELAKKKVDGVDFMIGYPDFIVDSKKLDDYYKELVFNADERLWNWIRIKQYQKKLRIRKLGEPKDKEERMFLPHEAAAFNEQHRNQIDIPAALLQPPLYDPQYPKYVNYGGIGVVMAHELTHTFDNEGMKYDHLGSDRQWLTNSTIENFEERTQCFIDQYNSYEVNGVNLVGSNTNNDDIADTAGLKTAFRAYQNSIKAVPSEKALPGIHLTNNQLFFVTFAQLFCSVRTREKENLDITYNFHSPTKYRVMGSVSNSVDFAREFKCPPTSAMNPGKKCEFL